MALGIPTPPDIMAEMKNGIAPDILDRREYYMID
jgi:hypothetical protein